MKKLKKALSLVLTLAMCLSLMPSSINASGETSGGASAALLTASSSSEGAELVTDGSFETQGADTTKSSDTEFWHALGTDGSSVRAETGSSTNYSVTANEGSYMCELDYQGIYTTVYQQIDVEPGSTLVISFAYHYRSSQNAELMLVSVVPETADLTTDNVLAYALTADDNDLSTDGVASVSDYTISPGTGWSLITAEYTVPAGVTTAYIAFQQISSQKSGTGNLIDSVSVMQYDYSTYVSSTGSDTTGEGTQESPYATLDKAVTEASGGGIVYVMDEVTVTSNTTIDKNLTITGAYTDSDGAVHSEGTLVRDSSFTGGSIITVSESVSVTLTDLTVDGNSLSSGNNRGIYNYGTLTATGCTFKGNYINGGAVNGAAVCSTGTATFENCVFTDNKVSTSAPAIESSGTLTVTDCTISDNKCTTSQGAIRVTDGTAEITGTSFTDNYAAYGGPALFVTGGTTTLSDVTITDNSTGSNTNRGAVWVNGGDLTVGDGVSITDNSVYGIYFELGSLNMSGNITIEDNTGGNVYILNSESTITLSDTVTGSIGVTQSGATYDVVFATASSESIASASVSAFYDDTATYGVKASNANLIWSDFVASVTDTDGSVKYYSTLQAAVDAAGSGDTVTLLTDTSEEVTVNTSFATLDWSGNTLTGQLVVEGSIDTIQNTVDGEQNYENGGIDETGDGSFVIYGTVGEIAGGRYTNSGNEALTVAANGTVGTISGGWFTGTRLAICWYNSSYGGTVITGGVFDMGSYCVLGYHTSSATGSNNADFSAIVIQGGYYESKDFTYDGAALSYTGTLSDTAATLPSGYGSITNNTNTYYYAYKGYYVSSEGSDTAGDGTRSNPYLTVYHALTVLGGDSGIIYIMDEVDFGSTTSNDLADGQELTIMGDPERDDDTEAHVTTTSTSSTGHLFAVSGSNTTMTVEDVIFDGNGTQRGFYWFASGSNGSVLNLNDGAVVTNFKEDRTYGGVISVADSGVSSGNVTINLNGGSVTGNNINASLGAIVLYCRNTSYAAATLNISGDSCVTGNCSSDNVEKNIVILNNYQIVLAGDFTGVAGVNQTDAAEGVQFGVTNSSSYAGSGNFTCDTNGNLSSTAGSDNTLIWDVNGDDIYVSVNGSDDTGNGSESNPYQTLLYAYSKVNDGGTIHVMTADVRTVVASGYVNALGKYISVSKNVPITGTDGNGDAYEGASIYHNNGNAPILQANNSSYTTVIENLTVTSAGTTLKSYGNADNALIDVRAGTVTFDNVTVTGFYNAGTAGSRSNIDWSNGTIRVSGGTLNLNNTTVTDNTSNGAVYKTGGTVNLTGSTSITGNTLQGTGGANLYLSSSSQYVNVVSAFAGTVGVTQSGATAGGTFAVADSSVLALAYKGMFSDDTGTYGVGTDGANLIWLLTSVSDVDNGTLTMSSTNASYGDTVTVTITPDEGYVLASLTVTDAGGNIVSGTLTENSDGTYTYTYTMPNSSTVTVAAELAQYSINDSEGGSTSVESVELNDDGTTTITIAADPDDGNIVSNLVVTYEDENGNTVYIPVTDNGDGTYSYTMPEGVDEVTVTTKFAPVDIDDTEGGTTAVAGTELSDDGTGTVTVTISADPDDGYVLSKLVITDGDGNIVDVVDNGDGTYSFVMPESGVSVDSSYAPVVIDESEGGTTAVEGTSLNEDGSVTVTISAVPDDGYKLGSLKIYDADGNEVEYVDNGDGTYSYVIPEGGVTVVAQYAFIEPITVSDYEHGTVTVNTTDAAAGDTVTITVTPDDGYYLASLKIYDVNGNEVAYVDNGDGTYSFIMPEGGVTIDAQFELESDGASVSGSGSGTKTGDFTPICTLELLLLLALAVMILSARKTKKALTGLHR